MARFQKHFWPVTQILVIQIRNRMNKSWPKEIVLIFLKADNTKQGEKEIRQCKDNQTWNKNFKKNGCFPVLPCASQTNNAPNSVITKREKKLMKIYKATDVPSHLQYWVNPDYVLLLSDTPSKVKLLPN